MENPQQKREELMKNYFLEVAKINREYDKTLEQFIENIMPQNAFSVRNNLLAELRSYSNNLVTQEEAIFTDFKARHNIDDCTWDWYTENMQDIQDMYEQQISVNKKNFVDDSTVPRWFIDMQKKQLKNVNINPQSIVICDSAVCGSMAHEIEYSFFSNHNESLTLGNVVSGMPSTIFVNPHDLNFENLDLMEGKTLLLAYMMKLSPRLDIPFKLKCLEVSVDRSELIRHAFLLRKHAALTAALESSRNAHCIKLVSSSKYCVGCSLVLHRQFCFINFCWKALDWVMQYYGHCNY